MTALALLLEEMKAEWGEMFGQGECERDNDRETAEEEGTHTWGLVRIIPLLYLSVQPHNNPILFPSLVIYSCTYTLRRQLLSCGRLRFQPQTQTRFYAQRITKAAV